MSGIYIPNMEMPTSCGFCRLRHADTFHGDACSITIGLWCEFQKRPDDCPLVPVPPHGRLIDLDAIPKEAWRGEKEDLVDELILAPTIIPASEEGE